MQAVQIATALASARVPELSEDRLAVHHLDDGVVVVVADGAGGIPGAAAAANMVLAFVEQAIRSRGFGPWSVSSWTELLSRADVEVDRDRYAGETTAVIVAASERGLIGTSCGDSGAWILTMDGIDDVTAHQRKKLRIGSGRARPIPFERPRLDGTLLVASDGLFNYARPEGIAGVVAREDLDEAAQRLVQLARLPSGKLADDVAIVLARPARSDGS